MQFCGAQKVSRIRLFHLPWRWQRLRFRCEYSARNAIFIYLFRQSLCNRQVLCHFESVLQQFRCLAKCSSAATAQGAALAVGATGAFIFHPPLHSQSSARIATELVSTNFSLSLCAILLSRAPPYNYILYIWTIHIYIPCLWVHASQVFIFIKRRTAHQAAKYSVARARLAFSEIFPRTIIGDCGRPYCFCEIKPSLLTIPQRLGSARLW